MHGRVSRVAGAVQVLQTLNRAIRLAVVRAGPLLPTQPLLGREIVASDDPRAPLRPDGRASDERASRPGARGWPCPIHRGCGCGVAMLLIVVACSSSMRAVTTVGSKWVPAQRRSSSIASEVDFGVW